MITFDSQNDEALQTFQRRSKKINKKKKFNLNKKMNSVLERRRFIDDICRFKNKN